MTEAGRGSAVFPLQTLRSQGTARRHRHRGYPERGQQRAPDDGRKLQRFKELLDFKYVGGVAKKSPVRLVVPEDGHWHLIVDMEGHHGMADSAVKVTPPPAAQRRAS